jgi:UTP--glucose-1-phosphate uridylyltransferase
VVRPLPGWANGSGGISQKKESGLRIRKAVIAVAGYGTRFLPATKVQPKEMLPVVDKPIVQYLVEEAVASGIEDIVFVTRAGTQAIADHFDSSRELEVHLEEQNKQRYLEIVQELPRKANYAFVRQSRDLPYGNGSPILAAKHFLDEGEPFVYMFGDDLVLSKKPCVQQLIEVYNKHEPAAAIAFVEIPLSDTCRFGMAKVKPGTDPMELESIEEKPAPEDSPTNLGQVGRFILPWRTVEILERRELGKDNELYLTDANHKLCREDRVLVHPIEGEFFTTGDPLPFLIANIQYALRHDGIGKEFAGYLRNLDLSKY